MLATAELRSVDPRILVLNPNNPRTTATPKAMDEQLDASLMAIGLIEPIVVHEIDDKLVVKAGDRRVKSSIRVGMSAVDIIVRNTDEKSAPMESLAENLVRAPMNSVDIWRGIQKLEKDGWNEQAIADALALPVRMIKRLRLLAHLHPAMLDFMAGGNMPNEEQLRTIAAASREEQAQVWKKYKPKRGQDFYWSEVARALSKRRMPFSAARFGEDLAKAYGIEWHEDLFAPAGEDGRFTTNVDAFFGAQQEWLQNSLPPERATLLTLSDYGQPQLPKHASIVYGKAGKTDITGYYLDQRSGEVRTTVYQVINPKKPAKGTDTQGASTDDGDVRKTRPDVTQKGQAMIGDLRTDALHEALQDPQIDDQKLLGLLILGFAGNNVSVHSGADASKPSRAAIAGTLTEGGALTADPATLRAAARGMLTAVLSCRENMSNSGVMARIAGEAISATAYLPNMATEAFLGCVSKTALERAARDAGVRTGARAKDTRGEMVERFKNATYTYPAAAFALTDAEPGKAKSWSARRSVYVAGSTAGSEGDADDAMPRDDMQTDASNDDDLDAYPMAAE